MPDSTPKRPKGAARPRPRAAGRLGPWVDAMREAMSGRRDAVVRCDGCVGCCASSQFVHIGPDEVETLAAIPRALLFPAPGAPRGHVLLGYDAEGRCPMLAGDRCSIYEVRPRTCRTYDCRVFVASGVDVGDDKPLVARRARAWRFTVRTPEDRRARDALRAASEFLRERDASLPEDVRPVTPTQRAVLSLAVQHLFTGSTTPPLSRVVAAIRRRRP